MFFNIGYYGNLSSFKEWNLAKADSMQILYALKNKWKTKKACN